jgi:alpha-glucosidase
MHLLPYILAIAALFIPVHLRAGDSVCEKISPREIHVTSDSAKVSLRFLSPSVVRVEYAFNGDFIVTPPTPAVIAENLQETEVYLDKDGSSWDIHTGALRVVVEPRPFAIKVYDNYQTMLVADIPGGYKKEGSHITCTKYFARNESIFGLGEKGDIMERRGGIYTMWNSDKPCYCIDEDPLYKSIPFFMSSCRYGIFFDNSWRTTFDFSKRDSYTFEADGGAMVYYIIAGEDYKDILRQYIGLTGRPVMPPMWALGFSQCRGLYVWQDQALDVARKFREFEIPCDVIYQDIGWTDNLQDFRWHRGHYQNPLAMLDSLHSMGFHVVVSQDPVISQRNVPQWREADSLGLFAKDIRTGKSYDMPWPWGGRCGVVDFTNPAAAKWWGDYQQKPIDDGVDGFWTDMGEPAWSNEEEKDRLNIQHYAGPHAAIHNVYGLYWDRVVTEEFNRRNPDKRLFQMTRAAFAGMQRYCFSWTGDSGDPRRMTDSWEQFAYQIPMMLSAGLGGVPFITGDITGYCGTIEDYQDAAELYVRWMQFGLFTPLSRAHHEGDTAVEPWMFPPYAMQAAKKAIELKYSLLPYIYTYAREAYETGLPIMRAMFLEFPEDKECRRQDFQFMFGPSLLVAPVVEQGATTREVYLPKGLWYDWYSGEAYEGGRYITVPAPLDKTPLFVKEGSIIPTVPVAMNTALAKSAPITLKAFLKEGQTASFTLYEDDGESLGYTRGEYSKTTFTCTSNGGVYHIDYSVQNYGGFKAPVREKTRLRIPVKKAKAVYVNGKKARKHSTNNSITVSL